VGSGLYFGEYSEENLRQNYSDITLVI